MRTFGLAGETRVQPGLPRVDRSPSLSWKDDRFVETRRDAQESDNQLRELYRRRCQREFAASARARARHDDENISECGRWVVRGSLQFVDERLEHIEPTAPNRFPIAISGQLTNVSAEPAIGDRIAPAAIGFD